MRSKRQEGKDWWTMNLKSKTGSEKQLRGLGFLVRQSRFRSVEELVPEWRRGWSLVETSEVPMPCRPLGSIGGRCDVWGLKTPFVSGCYFLSLWPTVHFCMSGLVCWPSTEEGKASHPSRCLSSTQNRPNGPITDIWEKQLFTLMYKSSKKTIL